MTKCQTFVLFVSFLLATVDGYRILGIFPSSARSHFNVNNAVMKSLVAAGHEVLVFTPFTTDRPIKNYTMIDLSHQVQTQVNQFTANHFADMSIYQIWDYFMNLEKNTCSTLMKHPEFQKMFQSEEKLFDAIFFEVIGLYECMTPIAAKWKIPTIGITTFASWGLAEHIIGNPRFPAEIPFEFGQLWLPNTVYGRFRNTLKHWWSDFVTSYLIWLKGGEFYEAHSNVLAPYSEYRKIKPSLIFFNSHFSIFPRAHNPNAIEIGGIHVTPASPLPEKIQNFIEDAESGVILFTLGSMVKGSTLSNKTILAFKEAFRTIPQRVIWKYEDEMDDVPENVLLLSWLPQRDILAHQNVKAFISHCGMSGFYEIVSSKKPVIAIPLYGDQTINANILQDKGAAIILDIKRINKGILFFFFFHPPSPFNGGWPSKRRFVFWRLRP